MINASVIVVGANQGTSFQRCVESLLRQTTDSTDYEILIVGCVHSESLHEWKRDFPAHSISIICARTGLMIAGLNQAILNAKGKYCLFIDSRVQASPSLISEHIRAQERMVGIIGLGFVQVPLNSRLKEDFGLFSKSQEASPRAASWLDCLLENLCIPRQKILDARGFCIELSKGYSLELAYRLAQNGTSVIRIDSAIVTLDKIPSNQDLLQQEEVRGASYAELWKKHPPLLPILFRNFYDTSLRGIILRRFMIAFAIPPYWMVVFSGWVQSLSWNSKWNVFFQQLCFWRGVHTAVGDRKLWGQLTYGVPILMYHAFCTDGEPISRFIHSIQRFRVQMQLLQVLGYRVISLEKYLECLYVGSLPAKGSLVITIDDGYLDNFTVAYPVIRSLNLPVTLFLVSDDLGKSNDWDEDSLLTGRKLLGAEEAKAMQNGLITFGAHTRTHPWLQNVSVEKARDEIINCKKELEQELGVPVQLFSYPHGVYDDRIVKIVEEAGYASACTTEIGLNTPGVSRFLLHRTEIYGTFSFFRFLVAVWSGR